MLVGENTCTWMAWQLIGFNHSTSYLPALLPYFLLISSGVNEDDPRGNSWKELDAPAGVSFTQISVSSDTDEVWVVSTANDVYYREGIEEETPYGKIVFFTKE